eukprot:scaffold1969_cov191-Alexandrium_tamarense.AAC.10
MSVGDCSIDWGEGIQWMDLNGMLLFDVESLFISGHRDGVCEGLSCGLLDRFDADIVAFDVSVELRLHHSSAGLNPNRNPTQSPPDSPSFVEWPFPLHHFVTW